MTCLPTVRFANWGGKSVVTRRWRRIWFSWDSVVCFSDLVMGSGGMILSCKSVHRNIWANERRGRATCSVGETLQTGQPYPYARGQARVRARGEDVDGKGDGEAGQPGVDESVSGQRCQPVRRVHKQDGLLVQEAGDHLLSWRWRVRDEKKLWQKATAV